MPIVLRPPVPADRAALLALHREAFGQEAAPAEWEWKYDQAPYRAISLGAFDGGKALGFFGGLGTRLRGAGGTLNVLAAVDVMTAPSTRTLGRRTLFQEVAEEFFRLNGEAGAPFVLGFPNERHRLAGARTLAYRAVEPAAQWERPLGRPGLAARIRRRLRRVVRGVALSPGHDALAEALHARAGWRSDRSRAVLAWRFARPGATYAFFELPDARGRARASAAVRVVGDKAILVDFQAADEDAGDAADLLDSVAEAHEGTAVTSLVLRAGSASRLAARAAELGFTPAATDTHVTVRLLRDGFDVDAAARSFDYRALDHEIF